MAAEQATQSSNVSLQLDTEQGTVVLGRKEKQLVKDVEIEHQLPSDTNQGTLVLGGKGKQPVHVPPVTDKGNDKSTANTKALPAAGEIDAASKEGSSSLLFILETKTDKVAAKKNKKKKGGNTFTKEQD